MNCSNRRGATRSRQGNGDGESRTARPGLGSPHRGARGRIATESGCPYAGARTRPPRRVVPVQAPWAVWRPASPARRLFFSERRRRATTRDRG